MIRRPRESTFLILAILLLIYFLKDSSNSFNSIHTLQPSSNKYSVSLTSGVNDGEVTSVESTSSKQEGDHKLDRVESADKPILVPYPGTDGDKFAPAEYYLKNREPVWCEQVYGLSYLRQLLNSRTEYCENNSSSSITCFGIKICDNCQRDNFCIVSNMAVNTTSKVKPFSLDCKLKDLGQIGPGGATPIGKFKKYMFDTGPRETFQSFIQNITHPAPGQLEKAAQACKNHKNNKEWKIFFKRDGTNQHGSHPWHGLMELFSFYLSLDVLRSGTSPLLNDEEMAKAQVVLLDEFSPGDFFSLWSLFTKKPVIRIEDLRSQLSHEDACLDNVIMPLAGASNPLWKGDWRIHNCRQSAILDVFVNRLMTHYGIVPDHRDPKSAIKVVFLTRPRRRKLYNQDHLISLLKQRFPHGVNMTAVDLWSMNITERIQLMSETDLLVGVHGSEITFQMFQPIGSSVVEIQPDGFNHFGFRNLAALRGQRYFRAHADFDKEAGWQKTREVTIEDERFISLVEAAIKSVLQRGKHHADAA